MSDSEIVTDEEAIALYRLLIRNSENEVQKMQQRVADGAYKFRLLKFLPPVAKRRKARG